MLLQSLMYHDVVPAGQFDRSGFRGHHADHYKLTTDAFDAHLQAILRAANATATVELPGDEASDADASPLLLTFDDGGVSALTEIAPRLEAAGCRGFFFITTDRIGDDGFLSAEQIRELADRGHVIGSHTCSHPPRISTLPEERLLAEWSRSRERLEAILQQPVRTASIPGGYYSHEVAATAMATGYTDLFTSEPTSHRWRIGGGWAYGRYAVTRLTTPGEAAALATIGSLACRRQWLSWNARKTAKRLAGPLYEPVRRWLLKTR